MNVIYIHIPRTGGGTVSSLLGTRKGHVSVEQHIEDIGLDAFSESLVITTVRNPFDRMVSFWASQGRYQTDPNVVPATVSRKAVGDFTPRESVANFHDWIETQRDSDGFINQVDWLTHNGKMAVDLILRFEDFEANWGNTIHVHKTEHDDWDLYYGGTRGRATVEFVQQRYATDFALLGYDLDAVGKAHRSRTY